MKNGSKHICKIYYYTTSRGLSKIIRINIDTYIELSVQARDQEFFRAGEVCWNKDTSINISCTTHKTEAAQGKLSEFFTP